ncbi:MAG TPA: chemotaxis response regulator protein-glutamate methylesterase [Methylomirabilota bacterium]|jgi:two-component system chemotaxis response regulator CheB|nr:chemotaxis response regulator protein-glutamate methylesterase [Methylomirabilota bacterium]
MRAIRILVVDDSVVVRKVLAEALATDASIEVAGTAADGNIALAKIPQVNPDLITLDVEMPGKSGIETLVEIRKLYPKLPVIMFSTLTERGAAVTLDALSLGASDYVTKPSNSGSLEQTRAKIQAELIPKIKELCRKATGQPQFGAPPKGAAPRMASRRLGTAARVDVLAVGTSTGGPNALAVVLPGLAKEFPVPIVIVQHMPPVFTRLLAERLNKQSKVEIREGEEGGLLKPGLAWIAPGDFHMQVARTGGKAVQLKMGQEPPENSCRPAADVLFRSVAQAYGPNVLAVVLTGMGSDGVRGSEEIKAAGGQVIVQDEASSVVWGMPGQTAAAGWADGIFPLAEMASEIERRVQASRLGLDWRERVPGERPAVKIHN